MYVTSVFKKLKWSIGEKYKKRKKRDGSHRIRLAIGLATVLNLVGPRTKWACFLPQVESKDHPPGGDLRSPK